MRVAIAFLLIGLLYLAFQKLFEYFWQKGFKVSVYCKQECAYEGDELTLIEEIENAKPMILPAVKVKFTASKYWEFEEGQIGDTTDQYYRNDLFSVGMYERVKRSLSFRCVKRGYYVFGDIDVFVSNFFYDQEYIWKQKQEQWVYVFAKRQQPPELAGYFKQMMGEIKAKKRLFEDPFSFAGIREYQNYDSMRSINWKASAKSGELMVNTRDYTAEQMVHILLYFEQKNVDWDKKMEEYAISLAATLSELFLQEQVRVSFVSNGRDAETGLPISIAEGADGYHMREIDQGIARIDLEQREHMLERAESFLEQNMQEEGLNVLVTTSQEPVMQEALCKKQEEACDFVWVFPHYEMEKLFLQERLQGKICSVIADQIL